MKDSFIIHGLAGKKTLSGSVSIPGAKNAALKAIAATVLFDGPVTLKNVPNTNDTKTIIEILNKLGAKIEWTDNKTLLVDTRGITTTDLDPQLSGNMRSSVVLTGPLLARFGKVSFPAPGGCVIGARPIDLFIEGYKHMGATVTLDEKKSIYNIVASNKLSNADITFSKVSVGATETLMMAATLVNGKTVLKNCALEPEIVNVAEWLVMCGADIQGVGTATITIQGTGGKLLSPQQSYVTIPDRITVGSFLILGALCAKELIIKDCRPEHVETTIELLRESGVQIETSKNEIIVKNDSVATKLQPFDVRTHEYPGFPTDLQPVIAVFLTQTIGESTLFESIFEGRFKYTEDLSKLGADITAMNPREILIKGPTPFKARTDGEDLRAHDIRAGFAVVLAALIADGVSTINNVHLIDRGYEKLEEQLTSLGAQVERAQK